MGKRKKVMMYVAITAASILSMAGCASVTASSGDEIITYTYNGNEKLKISTSEIVQKYLNEDKNEHASALFDALYEIVVRANFEEGGLLYSFKTKVSESADDAVTKGKEAADKAGQTWEEYLNGQGFDKEEYSLADKEKEFWLKSVYSAMTSTVDDQFFREFKGYGDGLASSTDTLQKKYNLLNGTEGWIQKYVPYHVKHILIQTTASQDYGYSRGHISSENADNIYKVVHEFVSSDQTFSQIANEFSQDPGNGENPNKKGGEYIMATDAGFVNEFQLGIYAYDLFFNPNVTEYKKDATYQEKVNNLFINEKSRETIENYGISYIPYGIVEKLEEVKDVETKDGLQLYKGDEDYFPRNIYFNKYFQNRNVGFITNQKALTTNDFIGQDSWTVDEEGNPSNDMTFANGLSTRQDGISGEAVWSDLSDAKGEYVLSKEKYFEDGTTEASKFIDHDKNPETPDILCDTDGNPIIVVRNKESSSGIHFMIIERSAFDVHNINFKVDSEAGITEGFRTELNEYYAPVSPKNTQGINSATGLPNWIKDFPNNEVKLGNGETVYYPKKTYVQTALIGTNKAFVDDTVTNYQTRVETLTTNMKKQISSYNKYDWLNSKLNISLNNIIGEDAQALVDSYIKKERTNTNNSNAKSFDEKWISYANSLDKQAEERKFVLLPEILALEFGNQAIYKTKGNPGYNAKYNGVVSGD